MQGTEQLALLLSTAAASLQQPSAEGALPAQQRHLALNFCLAVKVGSGRHQTSGRLVCALDGFNEVLRLPHAVVARQHQADKKARHLQLDA